MILKEEQVKTDTVIEVAKKMMLAAITAPKGKGRNTIESCVVTGDDLEVLAVEMDRLADLHKQGFFHRDANNVRQSDALLLIGTRIESLGLPFCGLCGMKNCETKNTEPEIPCMFNTVDLGIALGSAASIAADNRVDNRIIYTVGMAARELGLFAKEVIIIHGIPMSAQSKNIFFDRTKKL